MKIDSKKNLALLLAIAFGFGLLLNVIAEKWECSFLEEFSIIFPAGFIGEFISCYLDKREFSNTPKHWLFYVLFALLVATLFWWFD